jgi:hypothetical protein
MLPIWRTGPHENPQDAPPPGSRRLLVLAGKSARLVSVALANKLARILWAMLRSRLRFAVLF